MRLHWTPAGGDAVRLDRDPRWALLGVAGHGAPDTAIRTAGTPDRDERTPVHAPALPRIVTLRLQIGGDDLAAFERNRAALAAAFAPWRDSGLRARPGILTATLADGRVRSLRAVPRQGLSWGVGRQRGSRGLESISLEAPDPFWYDPAGARGRLRIGRAGALRFDAAGELAFPAGFGSDLPSAQVTVRNDGSVRSFPVLTLAGPSVNPRFRLGATGHELAFALTVPAGVQLRVRCGAQPDGSADAPAAHLIDDLGGESSVLGSLRTGSRFWALGPGDNRVLVAQESPAGGTTVEYAYFPRHVAI